MIINNSYSKSLVFMLTVYSVAVDGCTMCECGESTHELIGVGIDDFSSLKW